VAIARALGNNPRLILADEPTGELHSDDTANIITLFRDIQSEGHTVVVVTHDPAVAGTADRQIEIRDGQVVRDRVGLAGAEREGGR
jgi:macrolide transport system ATP-binding/permease protein